MSNIGDMLVDVNGLKSVHDSIKNTFSTKQELTNVDSKFSEVNSARQSGNGTTYNNLKARLDADKADSDAEIAALNESLGNETKVINTGDYTIQSADLVSGVWGYTKPTASANRLRSSYMFPVKKDAIINYVTGTGQEIYLGLAESKTSGSTGFLTTGWVSGTGSWTIAKDGYMTFNVRKSSDDAISISDYNSGVTIRTALRKNLDDLDERIESINEYNSYNLLDFFGPVNNNKNNGVTFTFNNRHTVILNGVLTAGVSFVNFFHDQTALPNGLKPDNNYIVSVKSSNNNVKLQITFYNSDKQIVFQKFFVGDAVIHVDDAYVGANFRIYVVGEIGDSFVNDTIECSLLEEPYHLNEKNIHTLEEAIDFNDIVNSGTYMLLGLGHKYINAPADFSYGYLEVVSSYALSNNDHTIFQTLYNTKVSTAFCYIRSYFGSSWKEWTKISVNKNEIISAPKLYDAPVKIFRSDQSGNRWFYVRTKFYGEFDVVYSLGTPGYFGIDNAFSLTYIKLIPSSTPSTAKDTISADASAPIYKYCKDEIPAFSINGVFVGSNHGNPNYTLVVSSSHGQTESDIGTVWTDSNNYEYTLVNVLNENQLVFGTLDSNGFLVVRNPEMLTKRNGNKTINVTSSDAYQLRRSAINRVYKYYNENGVDLAFGGSGNNVIISEDYDINDQSAGLAYLQDNVGTCTNSSYYDNAQTEHLAHVHNIFQFNRGGSITVYGSLAAKKSIVATTIFGMMSAIFGMGDDTRPDYMYIPNSGNAIDIITIDTSKYWSPTLADDGSMHYRYYQLTSNNNAHFLQFLNNYGDVNGEERRLIPYTNSAYYSAAARKFYLNVAKSKELANGDIYSWSYGRGPYKYSDSQTVLTYFDVGNGYVVSMDWHNGHSGYVKLPDYMSGMSVSVLDKTDSVTDIQEHTCLSGLKVNCSGYGYAVLLLS